MVVNFNDTSGKVVSPIKLAHVVLRTNNLEKMGEFYKEFLGGRYAIKVPNLTFITYDDEHHRIGLIGIPFLEEKAVKTNGLEHIAFTFSTMQELFLAYRQRKARGMEPYWCTNHGPTTSLYYYDPDGNTIETQYDNFPTEEAVNEFMEGEAYQTNPIGVDFDPEDVIKQIEQGADVSNLAKRKEIGPRSVDDLMAMLEKKGAV